MDSLWNTDAFTSTRNNPRTGKAERKWIEYADGMFEPVRKGGNLNNKYHGNKRELDWWTVEKPVDWNPLDDGKQVTLDHDYRRPGTERKTKAEALPALGKSGDGKAAPHRTMELRPEDLEKSRPEPMPFRPGEKREPVLFAAAAEKKKPGQEDQATLERPETPAKPEGGERKKPAPKTTLLRGAEAYHEFEAALKAEKDASAKEGP